MTVQQAHRRSVSDPLTTIAGVLQDVLSRRVTAFIVGVRDAKSVSRWASGEVTEIRDPEVEQRLRTTYAIVQMLLGLDAPVTIRAWFLGMNPELEDASPAEAIRDGNGRDAMSAARVFITNG